jgi:hypothetical protein
VLRNALCQVRPTVTITSVSFSANSIPRINGETRILVQLSASTGVPTGTTVLLEAFQNTNPNGVQLSIEPPSGTTNAEVTAGQATTNMEFKLKTPNIATSAGFVTYRVRILDVTEGQTEPPTIVEARPADGVVSGNLCVGTLNAQGQCVP